MTFDWTSSSTWTFQPGEYIAIANGAIQYCDNCMTEYPEAKSNLANLRQRALQLREFREPELLDLTAFLEILKRERLAEGTGFSILFRYVSALHSFLVNSEDQRKN